MFVRTHIFRVPVRSSVFRMLNSPRLDMGAHVDKRDPEITRGFQPKKRPRFLQNPSSGGAKLDNPTVNGGEGSC